MPTRPRPNPYVGPRPIQIGEALYGRAAEVRELFHRLQARRIVVLHSPSGAGKSSLVAAGLIPKLLEARYDVWRTIRVNLDPSGLEGVPPGTNRYLLSALLSLEEELPAARRRGPADLAGMDLRAYLESRPRRRGRADRSVLLIFDQFEEVLTVAPRALEQKRDFFTSLGQALDVGDIWALFVIREDYLGALAPYRDRVPTQLGYAFRLDLLGLAGAREVAVELAQGAGRDFPGADRLITDLSTVVVQQPDGSFLPEQGLYVEPVQLQVVCHRLWEAMPAEDTSIEAEDFGEYVDVSMALGSYYAACVGRIAAGNVALERALRDWVGSRLIVSGIRSQVRQEVGQSAGLDNTLITKLKDSYLVRSDTRAGATWFELSHDRLVEAVIKDNLAWEANHLHTMQAQARLWEQGKRSASLLLSAGALPEASAWAAQNSALLTEGEREFLEISTATRAAQALARRRSRALTVALTLLLALAMMATGLAWLKAQEARDQSGRARTATAMASGRELLASGRPVPGGLVLAAVKSPDDTRGWRDLMSDLVTQPGRLDAVLLGHTKDVRSAAWSPDGTRIVTTSDDGTARVWPAVGEGAPIELRGHSGEVLSAAWSPDGARIVTSSIDGTARVWRSDGAGEPLVLRGHDGDVISAAWSPDGARILTASGDGTARVWQANEEGEPLVLAGHAGAVLSAGWSPDGAQVATASADGTARVWRANEAGEPLVLRGHVDDVLSVAWSPDGSHLVTASKDKTARVWSSDGTGAPVVLAGHDGRVVSARWSPDGAHILTASWDGTVRVWGSDGTGEPLVFSGQNVWVVSAEWSPDGSRVVAASWDGAVRVWNSDGTGQPFVLNGHQREVFSAQWSPDGTRIVTPSADSTARVWRVDGAGQPLELRGYEAGVKHASWSPDGTQILTLSSKGAVRVERSDGTGQPITLDGREDTAYVAWSPDGARIVTGSLSGAVRVWWTDGSAPPVELYGPDVEITLAAWSPDGTQLVTTSADGASRVWRADGAGSSAPLLGHDGDVRSAAWSPDGTRIVTASDDGTARVWRADGTGEPMVLRGHEAGLNMAAWSPDGTRIVTASEDGTARVWRSDGTGAPVVLDGDPELARKVVSAAWSPDGTRILLASEGWMAQLWQADGTGEPIYLYGHESGVSTAQWSPDGTWIVTVSGSGVARLWPSDESTPPIELRGHDAFALSAAWSPDGTRILTPTMEGTVRIWWLTDALLALVPPLCLSPAQRELYLVEGPADARANYEDCERSHGRAPVDNPPDL